MNTAISQTTTDQTQNQEQEVQPAPPLVELLDAPPPVMRRPLALVDGRAYAAAWLYVRTTTTQTQDKNGNLVHHDPPLVQTRLRLFVIRDDGVLFGPGGDAPLSDLGLDVTLPEMPHPSRTWSIGGINAYRAGRGLAPVATPDPVAVPDPVAIPDPIALLNRIADVVSRFVDFDRSLADQRAMAEMLACYTLATWFLPAFNVIGYLWPSGERGSGKTVLLHTVAGMAYLGHVILAGGTYASLRDLAEYGATLAFDDAESLSDLRKTDPDKRSLLLAGNRRGSTITVKEMSPDKAWRTRHVNAFCPRLFSAIQLPDNVLASRSIVIPLIRTSDRHRANADPLDDQAWPHDRRQLIDDLWALSLAHLPHLREYERAASQKARLAGRTLEPWRAILAIALWIDDHDTHGILRRPTNQETEFFLQAKRQNPVSDTHLGESTEHIPPGLWDRIETLSVQYQRERSDLESDDLTTLIIRAICLCALDAIDDAIGAAVSADDFDFPADFILTTDRVTDSACVLARANGSDTNRLTNHRVGRVLGSMRLEKAPRPGGRGSRRWRITPSDLKRWTEVYGILLPTPLDQLVAAYDAPDEDDPWT